MISNTINTVASGYTCITPSFLFGLCRNDVPIHWKIFRACLNAEARRGQLELVRCLSQNGNPFKVVVASSKLDEFRIRVFQIIDLAQKVSEITVRQIQDAYYPDRPKGTWFVAQQMLQRAAYLGYLMPQDKWSFKVPDTLLNAQTEVGGQFHPPKPTRLA